MPQWKYILKRTVATGAGARKALALKIRQGIRTRKLTIELPVMKIETTPGREFYIGLAVNDERCESGRPPDYLIELFDAVGLHLSAADLATWPTAPEDVDEFLKGSFEWDYLTIPLHFEPGLATELPDSLNETEEIEAAENREAYDRLLWWCSSKASGTVTQLSEITGKLGLTGLEGSVWGVIKNLSLLGHLDVSLEARGWTWRVAPLTVVETASGEAAFLAGAQSAKWRDRLVEKAGATLDGSHGGPSKLSLPSDSLAALETILGFAPRSAAHATERWAELLPTLEEWQATLVPDPDIGAQPHHYSLERYSGNRFTKVNGNDPPSGFYRVERQGEQFRPKHVFRTANGRWLNGDFSSLRFLALTSDSSKPRARQLADGTLLIPWLQRWPTLYERALVLASGQLPSVRATGVDKLLVYATVPAAASEKLAAKLGVKLTS